MKFQYHVLLFVLAIGASFGSSDDALETEGTCNSDNPETCSAQAAIVDSDAVGEENSSDDDDCIDDHEKCPQWSEMSECENNPNYMLRHCRRSCLQCPSQAEELAKKLEEKRKSMKAWTEAELEVAADMGKMQNLENTMFRVTEEQALERINAAREHLLAQDDKLKELCKNDHEDCTTWAVAGECEKNYKYMVSACGPACMSCDQLLLENRCPIDKSAEPAWKPGSLNAMFEYLISEEVTSKYPATILSRDPWVVTLDDVISEEEALRLIELGGLEGYKRSEDVGEKKADGSYGSVVSTGRTSSNAWCVGDCYTDPVARNVMDRLSNLTMINETNSEFLQLLRYEPGQFYEDHHDYIEHNIDNQQGVRILTSYLYLNDVEAGGGTKFTNLDITVMPKRGRALFWPSVRDDDPHRKDRRTNHQALPVEAGVKYGANGWYHQFDFKTPYEKGCTG